MPGPKLSKLELGIMETLWNRGEASIRDIQESFPENSRPSYGTIQITVNRMERRRLPVECARLGTFTLLRQSFHATPRNGR